MKIGYNLVAIMSKILPITHLLTEDDLQNNKYPSVMNATQTTSFFPHQLSVQYSYPPIAATTLVHVTKKMKKRRKDLHACDKQ